MHIHLHTHKYNTIKQIIIVQQFVAQMHTVFEFVLNLYFPRGPGLLNFQMQFNCRGRSAIKVIWFGLKIHCEAKIKKKRKYVGVFLQFLIFYIRFQAYSVAYSINFAKESRNL